MIFFLAEKTQTKYCALKKNYCVFKKNLLSSSVCRICRVCVCVCVCVCVYSMYLLYQYKRGPQFTYFTSKKVQILTQRYRVTASFYACMHATKPTRYSIYLLYKKINTNTDAMRASRSRCKMQCMQEQARPHPPIYLLYLLYLLYWYKSTNTASLPCPAAIAAASITRCQRPPLAPPPQTKKLTCFTSTKVQIVTMATASRTRWSDCVWTLTPPPLLNLLAYKYKSTNTGVQHTCTSTCADVC
jgi:hypothetical protein